jgi:hypothetical protein
LDSGKKCLKQKKLGINEDEKGAILLLLYPMDFMGSKAEHSRYSRISSSAAM